MKTLKFIHDKIVSCESYENQSYQISSKLFNWELFHCNIVLNDKMGHPIVFFYEVNICLDILLFEPSCCSTCISNILHGIHMLSLEMITNIGIWESSWDNIDNIYIFRRDEAKYKKSCKVSLLQYCVYIHFIYVYRVLRNLRNWYEYNNWRRQMNVLSGFFFLYIYRYMCMYLRIIRTYNTSYGNNSR